MAKIVDHSKRKQEILAKAIDLFSTEGYQNVTYQMIASRCGIQRTALYRYFPTKRSIFEGAIKSITDELRIKMDEMLSGQAHLCYAEQIVALINGALDMLSRHIPLIQNINEYLISQQRLGQDVKRRVRHHTIAARRALINMVRCGIAAGEFAPVSATMAGDLLYGLLESAAMRLAISETANLPFLKQTCRMVVNGLKATP